MLQICCQQWKDADGDVRVPISPLWTIVAAFRAETEAEICTLLVISMVSVDTLDAPVEAVTLGCGQVVRYLIKNACSECCPLVHEGLIYRLVVALDGCTSQVWMRSTQCRTYPTNTGIRWAIRHERALSSAHTSALCSIRWVICGIGCCR